MPTILPSAIDCLYDLIQLLNAPHKAPYTRRPPFANSTIGEHVRHIISHFDVFLDGLASKRIDYNMRGRSRSVEQCADSALNEVRTLLTRMQACSALDGNQTLITVLEDGVAEGGSTVSRELSFLANHSQHHLAIIKFFSEHFGCPLPDDFGVSDSTRRYKQTLESTCAH